MTRGWRFFTLSVAVVLAGCTDSGPAETGAPEPRTLACQGACPIVIDDGPGAAWEPMLAVNPNNPSHLVVAAAEVTHDEAGLRHTWDHAYSSFDGGVSWTKTRIPGGEDAGPSHPLFTATETTDPVAIILGDGTVVFVGLAYTLAHGDALPLVGAPPRDVVAVGTTLSLFATRSTDGGLTFEEPAIVTRGEGVQTGLAYVGTFQDKPWITAGSDGTLLMVWNSGSVPALRRPADGTAEDLHFAVSEDGGKTWSPPRAIAEQSSVCGFLSGPSPLVLDSGRWLVAYTQGGTGGVFVARSDDRGTTWEATTVVEAPGCQDPLDPEVAQIPTMKYDAATRRVLLAFPAVDAGQREAPALVESHDEGRTWSGPLRLDEARFPGRIFTTPLDVGADGTVFVGYYWYRDNAFLDYRIATLRDGQAPSVVALAEAMPGPVVRYGHYSGVASVPERVMATWGGGQEDPELFGAILGWRPGDE